MSICQEFTKCKGFYLKLGYFTFNVEGNLKCIHNIDLLIELASNVSLSLQSQILELEGDNFRLAESVRCLTASLEEERSAVTAASCETSADVLDAAGSEGQGENLVEKMADLMSDHKLLTDEHQTLLTEYGDMDLKLSDSQHECEALHNQNEALRKQSEALDNQNKALQSQKEALLTQNEAVSLKYNRLQTDYEKLESESENLSRQINSLTDEISSLRAELDKAQAERDEIKERLQGNDEVDGRKVHPSMKVRCYIIPQKLIDLLLVSQLSAS